MIPREDENREVTDFFGWAIHSLRHVLSNEYARMQELKWETTYTLEEEEEMIRFVDQMRIFHTEALLDKQYLHECYTSCHQLKNKGWLSLVAKEYFPFARYLLHQIRSSVNVQEWARRGNGVIESAAKTLEEDKSLAVLFLDAAKSCSLDEKMKKKIMSALIRKVLHARAAAEHDKFKEQKTNREAQGSTTTSFRGALKVLSKRNEKGKKTKKQRTSASIDDIGEHNSQMCLDE
jgi:type IV secretory pathway TrbF-like protein